MCSVKLKPFLFLWYDELEASFSVLLGNYHSSRISWNDNCVLFVGLFSVNELYSCRCCRLVRWAEGKHNLHLRFPDEFKQLVEKFLDEPSPNL